MADAPNWRFKELIAMLGGPAGVAEKLTEVGIDAPPVSSICGWRRRQTAPGNWTLAILLIAQREGLLGDIDALRKTGL